MANDTTVIKLDMDTSPAENSLSELDKHMQKIMNSRNASGTMKNLTRQIHEAITTTESLKKQLDDTLNSKEHTKTFDAAISKAKELKRLIGEETSKLLASQGLADTKSNRKMAEQAFLQSRRAKDVNTKRMIKDYRELQVQINNLVKSGQKFYIDDKTVTRLNNRLTVSYNRVSGLIARFRDLAAESQSFEARMRRVASTMRVWNIITNNIRKATQVVQNTYNKLLGIVKKLLMPLKTLRKESAKHTTSASSGFKHLFRNVMRYGLGIRSLYFLFRKLRQIAVESLGEIAKMDAETNRSISSVVKAFNQLKGSVGGMIQPLISVFAPALVKLLGLLTKVANAIATIFAMLTGKGYIMTATAQEVDYAASLDKTAGSAKKAKKALEGYLSPIDEINKYKKDEDSGSGDGAGYTLTKTPIDASSLLADWTKKFLDPIKKAWAKVGSFVKTSWSKAFGSLKTLAIDVIEDFLEVWNQDRTLEMLEGIFRIFGRIGAIVDELITKFDIAWNKNKIGKQILESIRDIFATIVDHIDRALGLTEAWVMQLDFSPLLEAVQSFLVALEPLVGQIMTVFSTFYTEVLLPLGQWAIEQGLPKLIGVFTDLANTLTESGLSDKLQELWKHLEPFAERVGEGLISFLSRLADAIGRVVTSDAFLKFIDKIGEWMDSVSASDVEGAIWGIVAALVALKSVIGVLSALATFAGIAKTVMEFVTLVGKDFALALSTALAGLSMVISGVILAVTNVISMFKNGWSLIKTILEAIGIALATIGVIILAPIEGVGVAIAAVVAAVVFVISQAAIIIHQNWDKIVEWTKAMWTKVKTWFTDGVTAVKTTINNVVTWIKSVPSKLATVWTNIKTTCVNTFNSLKTSVVNIFNGLWNSLKGVINSILGGIEKMANGIVNGINTAIGAMNNLKFDVPGWVPVVGGNHMGFNIPTLGNVSIPRLAQGAVIPPNKEFLATLGDQKRGTNIETPLATMVEAFNQALNQRGGNGKTEITFVLPNKQQVAQYVIEGGRVLQTSRGSNPFNLA